MGRTVQEYRVGTGVAVVPECPTYPAMYGGTL